MLQRRKKIKAYVFSIGEKTTDLCCELMKEYGFEVVLYQDQTSLWDKLKRFYTEALATGDEEVVRIDADVIPNKNVLKMVEWAKEDEWGRWTCAMGWDWYKQEIGAISIHVMHHSVIEECLNKIESAKNESRPETHLWRLKEVTAFTELYNGEGEEIYCGLHGYGQREHRKRIKDLKYNRGQDYDWDLIDRIEALNGSS